MPWLPSLLANQLTKALCYISKVHNVHVYHTIMYIHVHQHISYYYYYYNGFLFFNYYYITIALIFCNYYYYYYYYYYILPHVWCHHYLPTDMTIDKSPYILPHVWCHHYLPTDVTIDKSPLLYVLAKYTMYMCTIQ